MTGHAFGLNGSLAGWTPRGYHWGQALILRTVDSPKEEAFAMKQSRSILLLRAGVWTTLAWTISVVLSAAAAAEGRAPSAGGSQQGVNRAAGPPQAEEMQKRGEWLKDRLLRAPGQPAVTSDNPVFSFVYGQQPSAKLLAAWPRKGQTSKLANDRTQHTLTWSDATTGLEVRCVAVQYADFPVVEWTAYFKNAGKENLPLLENVQAIDTEIERAAEGEYLLKYNKGDTCAPDLYQPLETVLEKSPATGLCPAVGVPPTASFPTTT